MKPVKAKSVETVVNPPKVKSWTVFHKNDSDTGTIPQVYSTVVEAEVFDLDNANAIFRNKDRGVVGFISNCISILPVK